MARFVATVLLLAAIALASALQVPLLEVDSKAAIDGQYIIVFHSNITHELKFNHIGSLYQQIENSQDSSSRVITSYTIGKFHAFAAKLSSSLLEEQRRHTDLIDFIEPDQVVTAFQSCSSQSNAIWGLDRIAERAINLDGIYHYSASAGQNVDAYIVDTGIYTQHSQFAGRAVWGANFADTQNTDCNGHGTHVAGTVGGSTYGVAKKVTLIAVKVLDCKGSGTNTGVISGIEYVVAQHKKTGRASVANMSLGGGKSTALNTAVKNAITSGVTFAVAAGNENADACNSSPASTPEAVTVGATTIESISGQSKDTRASFSNYGTCVHLFAPGELIKSAWIGSTTATNTISGTSMATPHVAGVVALYLGANPNATPTAVKTWLTSNASSNLITLDCSVTACTKSPNKLLYSPC